MATEPKEWSVFDTDGRLVLLVSEVPGAFHFARALDDDTEGLTCAFGSVRSFDAVRENDIVALLARSDGLDDFLMRLAARYAVVDGPPRTARFARL